MDSTIYIAIIGALGTILGALIGKYAGRRKNPGIYRNLEFAMDDLVSLLRESMKDHEVDLTASSLFTKLRSTHSINHVLASFYLLRERGIIRWEDGNILKPEHRISLIVR